MKSKNIYKIPLDKKHWSKAISDPRAHFAHFKYALDFPLPEGTKILAPFDGEIIDIKMDSKKGGLDPKYNDLKYYNYITIKHKNGEYSQYVHLQYKGALVKIGDKVKKGQPIALSGNTGLSSEPHLHFQVFKLNKTKIGWETVEIRFKEKIEIDRSTGPPIKSHEKLLEELEKVKKEIESSKT